MPFTNETLNQIFNNEKVFYMSGYNGSSMGFLMGTKSIVKSVQPKTADELVEIALSQELM